MNREKKNVWRVDSNFALCEASYWASYCAVSGFTTVYLSWKGLNNTQIGWATSLASILAIVLQLVLSNFSDRHPSIAIKKMISVLFFIGIAAGAAVHFLPLPIACMIAAYSAANAMGMCNNGYLNAMLVQFNNAGIPAHYGWPRGVGSICYASAAYFYGVLAEKYTPAVLMPIFLIGTAICIVIVLCMPDPVKMEGKQSVQERGNSGKGSEANVSGKNLTKQTSYREMISGNPELLLLLVCVFIDYIGLCAGYTFIVKVVESLGGTTADYGLFEFVRAGAEMPMLFLSGFFLKRFHVRKLVAAAFFAAFVRIFLLGIAPSLLFVFLSSCCNCFCTGFYTFSSVLFVNSLVKDTEKVRGQSLVMLVGSIGSIVGNCCAGMMVDQVGLRPMMITASLFCLSAGILLLFVRTGKQK